MKSRRFFLFLWIDSVVLSGCSDDRVSVPERDSPVAGFTDTEKLNKFIIDCTQEVYLWESLTDWRTYNRPDAYRAYPDPYPLFGEFVYRDDHWSALTNHIDSWKNTFQGVSTTYGYDLIRGQFSNTGHYFAIVLYTGAGSPAAHAGLKRGDIIVGINGGDITQENYGDLYDSSSLSLQLGYIGADGTVGRQPGSVAMVAVEMYENPVHTSRIIEKGGRKIGYLCYTAFINTSERELQAVFDIFKKSGVTDVVLDLRYNSGGHTRTAQILSSLLAPQSVVANKEVYLTQEWNNLYNQYWAGEGKDHREYFVDTLAVNMDLKQLYVLTSAGTASASEAVVIGLKPYMDVVLIGDTTHGKYYGGYLLSVDDYYQGSKGYDKEHYLNISDWGMYIMVYRYANKNNYPGFSGGLAPDLNNLAMEDYFDLKPFGDESDPLLGKALERITGEKYVEKRSSASGKIPSHTLFPEEMRRKNPVKNMLIHTEPFPRLHTK